jgi:hypothetical protein
MPQAAIRHYEDDEHMQNADVDQHAVSQVQAEDLDSSDKDVDATSPDTSSQKQTPEEPFYHYTVDTKDPDPWLIVHKTKIIVIALLATAAIAGNMFYNNMKQNELTNVLVSAPQLNDLYYIDFRLMKDNLRPAEKFRMAKVNDITGDVVTINFSSYFYFQEHELNEAIRYAQLRFEKFFQEKRHNFTISELQGLIKSGAIVLARRPEGNMLDGNVVVPDSHFKSNSIFIPGKKENLSGLEYMRFVSQPDKAALAFEKFEESADLGFAQGQVNLAQMYLNGTAVEKDLYESLDWLKQASLQAYEPAILKYAIVCQKIESCGVAEFYQELVKAGVNIEFTKQADVRATTEDFARDLEKLKPKVKS